MKNGQIMNFLSVNRSVTNLGGASRHFRLPGRDVFPKLDVQRVRAVCSDSTGSKNQATSFASPDVVRGEVRRLPEMTMDSLEGANGFSVKNVKLGRSKSRFWSLFGIRSMFRMRTEVHRAARG